MNFIDKITKAISEQSPLQMAALLEEGADFSIKIDGKPLLLYVLEQKNINNNHVEIVELILSSGVSPNIHQLPWKLQPIHIAVINQNIELIKLLLKYGANPNIKKTIFPLPFGGLSAISMAQKSSQDEMKNIFMATSYGNT